jgi:GT2 family glycosyltransferase
MSDKPFIDVVIPYEPCKLSAVAYNRAMEQAKDWVLILDHDIFLCNPMWYEAALDAVMKLGHKAGWITAVTNRTPCSFQKSQGCPEGSDNLIDHIRWAEKVWEKHGSATIRHDGIGYTGFWILTHKEAWAKVGKFPETNGFHVDGDYSKALYAHGYETHVMPGVYVYHLEDRKKEVWKWAKWKNFGTEWRVL